MQLADQPRKSETGTCKEMASMSLKKEPSGDAVVLNEDLEFDLPVPRPVKTENVVDIKSAVDDKIRQALDLKFLSCNRTFKSCNCFEIGIVVYRKLR